MRALLSSLVSRFRQSGISRRAPRRSRSFTLEHLEGRQLLSTAIQSVATLPRNRRPSPTPAVGTSRRRQPLQVGCRAAACGGGPDDAQEIDGEEATEGDDGEARSRVGDLSGASWWIRAVPPGT